MPLLWCLIAFILTFFVTRTITRYIRATADQTGPRKWWQPHNISVSDKSGSDGSGMEAVAYTFTTPCSA